MLWEKVLQNDVKCSTGDAQKAATEGVEKRDDGASFLPPLLFFEVDHAVRDCEIFSESAFVSGA